jgi:anti-sigma factor RsiW
MTTPPRAHEQSTGDEHASTDELSALLDGELPPSEAARVSEHRDRCAACRGRSVQLAAARQVVVSADRSAVAPPDGAVDRAVRAALVAAAESAAVVPIDSPLGHRRTTASARAASARRQRVMLGTAAGIAVVALVGGAYYGIRHSGLGSSSSGAPAAYPPAHNGLRVGRHQAAGSPTSVPTTTIPATTVHGGPAATLFTLWAVHGPVRCSAYVGRQPPAGDIVVKRPAATGGPACLLLGPLIAPVKGTVVHSNGGVVKVRLQVNTVASARYDAAESSAVRIDVVELPDVVVGSASLGSGRIVIVRVSPQLVPALRRAAG